MRPSIVFGPEDSFFNLFAKLSVFLPVLPLIGGGHTKFQPVYVGDVARAIVTCLQDPTCRGKTYELGGPQIYSFKALLKMLMRETRRRRLLFPLPFALAMAEAAVLELWPIPPLTRDQVRMLRRDNVVSEGALKLQDLGITPTAVEVILPTYMALYRKRGQFADRVTT